MEDLELDNLLSLESFVNLEDVGFYNSYHKSISIPTVRVGTLIGRGGANIRALCSKSGTRIQVKDNNGSGSGNGYKKTSSVSISGGPKQIKTAERLIHELIGETETEKIKIGHAQIPVLIGAKGANIRWIREQSGASIDVINVRGRRTNADAFVQISGNPIQIQVAQELIHATIDRVDSITEMTIVGKKLNLRQLDENVKEQDLVSLFTDAGCGKFGLPEIKIRLEKGEFGRFATCTFHTHTEAELWFKHLNGIMLIGRRVLQKKQHIN